MPSQLVLIVLLLLRELLTPRHIPLVLLLLDDLVDVLELAVEDIGLRRRVERWLVNEQKELLEHHLLLLLLAPPRQLAHTVVLLDIFSRSGGAQVEVVR